MPPQKTKNNQGFTVVELIVAMSIFAILLTVAVGSFVQGIRSQRILTHLMEINNNAGLVLERIAREVRTGDRFCGDLLTLCNVTNQTSLSFTNYKNESVSYALAGNAISRNGVPITADNVKITYLNFSVSQQGSICKPWRITIAMGVSSKNAELASQVTRLQTTISSRVLPIEARFGDISVAEQIYSSCSP